MLTAILLIVVFFLTIRNVGLFISISPSVKTKGMDILLLISCICTTTIICAYVLCGGTEKLDVMNRESILGVVFILNLLIRKHVTYDT